MAIDKQDTRGYWRGVARTRPTTIPIPGPGQESVWDYPRPPRIESVPSRIRVEHQGVSSTRDL